MSSVLNYLYGLYRSPSTDETVDFKDFVEVPKVIVNIQDLQNIQLKRTMIVPIKRDSLMDVINEVRLRHVEPSEKKVYEVKHPVLKELLRRRKIIDGK